ncbi:phosphatidylserine/phosphatidylglycerophosphate/cardiolipin synthase family protein [Bosea sp. (in: a-proteobacteria)]|jgi:hypothetical protein|uniref:phosphatidylserine/phosphatidylglycerophosphate/ cardiolipin synthase family protein n=1 Tax=Bosea sp. (in: a-proteobacteria) TaxID=1871050 RepID=UPI003F7143FC
MNDQEAFARVTALIQEAPQEGATRQEVAIWLSKSNAVVEALNVPRDLAQLSRIAQLEGMGRSDRASTEMAAILLRSSARIELRLPVEAQGAFVGVGNAMDALAAVARILQEAKKSARIIDPYMDEKALTSFAVLANEGVTIELMSDAATVRPALVPAVGAWRAQYKARPLDARLASPRALHDRIFIVDALSVFIVSQSLKDIAARSPASIMKADAETAALKVAAYDEMWAAAVVIA